MRSSSQQRADSTVGDSIVRTVTRQNSVAGPDRQPMDLTETISIETTVVDEHGQPVPEEFREEALRMLHASSDAAGLSMQQSAESAGSGHFSTAMPDQETFPTSSAGPPQHATLLPATRQPLASAASDMQPLTPAPALQQATAAFPSGQTRASAAAPLPQAGDGSSSQTATQAALIQATPESSTKPSVHEPQLRADTAVGDSLAQQVTQQNSMADEHGNPMDITETVSIETTVVDEHGNPVGLEQQAAARQLLQDSSHAAGQRLDNMMSPAGALSNLHDPGLASSPAPAAGPTEAAQHSNESQTSGSNIGHQLPRSTPPEAHLGLQTATAGDSRTTGAQNSPSVGHPAQLRTQSQMSGEGGAHGQPFLAPPEAHAGLQSAAAEQSILPQAAGMVAPRAAAFAEHNDAEVLSLIHI